MSPETKELLTKKVLLVGNPNSGKSLFFSRLTGQKTSSANYSGTTLNLKSSNKIINGQQYDVVDLPGLYDLETDRAEELVTVNYLNSSEQSENNLILFFLDATRLDQGIYLLTQILDKNFQVVVLLTQFDIAKKNKIEIDLNKLSITLKVSIIPTSNLADDVNKIFEQALLNFSQTLKSDPTQKFCTKCSTCNFKERHLLAREIRSQVSNNLLSSRLSDRLDRIFLHPLLGTLSFLLITFLFFWLIFFIASWPMDWIDQAFAYLTEITNSLLPTGFIQDLTANGIIAGLNGAIIFLPQIFILFFLLNLLDNSGYLARIVCIMDRFLRKFGLPGTAFLPVLSAHACAIPAILGTKVIKNKAQRWLTIFIIPFFSCSARLPVYVMLTALLFPDSPVKAALIFISCYFSGGIIAFLTALIISKFFLAKNNEQLLIELPAYRYPPLKLALQEAVTQSIGFLKKAGTFIVAFSIVIWALSTFPNSDLEKSYLAIIGNFVQPIFEPLGFDWRITIGILTSFAAREVIVSTLAIIFQNDGSSMELASRLQQATLENGNLLFSFDVIVSLLVFFIFALQCFPTSVTAWKETGSKKFAVAQFVYASLLAYLLAWLAGMIARLVF